MPLKPVRIPHVWVHCASRRTQSVESARPDVDPAVTRVHLCGGAGVGNGGFRGLRLFA
jgi:hypothetical protein